MQIEVLEKDKDKMKIAIKDETHTLTQLLATTVWGEGGEAAAIQEHPFMEEHKIIVTAKNPQRVLEKASIKIQKQCDEFKDNFTRALQK